MDIRRLQRANGKFEHMATEVEAEAKKLKAEASIVGKALEASNLKQAELELGMEQLTSKKRTNHSSSSLQVRSECSNEAG